MDAKELAALFIQRAETKQLLDSIDEQITDAVLEIGESQQIAGVKATYYKPSFSVDYEALARHANADEVDIEKNTKIRESVSWLGVCKSIFDDFDKLDIVEEFPAFVDEKPARVVIK